MKKTIIIFLLSILSIASYAQTLIGGQLPIKLKVASWGGTQNALLSLPDDYDKTNEKYPLILFFHGIGEKGSTEADLSKLLNNGLPKVIASGQKIQAINPIDKKLYKFIIISPQHWGWTTTPDMIEYLYKDLQSRFRIDTTRFYLTGLSAGGQGVMQAISYNQSLTNSITAIVPMSPAMPDANMFNGYKFLANKKVAGWFFSGTTDPGAYTKNAKAFNDTLNKYNPNSSKITLYPGGHCCWVSYYDTSYKENSMNIYQWMLQYKNGSTFVENVPSKPIDDSKPTIPPITTPPVIIDTSAGNVNYTYYEVGVTKLPDFSKLTPYKKGSLKNFKLDIARVKDNFAIVFESYIKIDSTGNYSFGTNSDDGSKLIIDSTIIVNNDGAHSASYKEGTIKLVKGVHKIRVEYFEAGGDAVLEVFWKPIGTTTKIKIPDEILVEEPIIVKPPIGNPKEVGRFKFIDIEVILYDNLTWEYIEQIK